MRRRGYPEQSETFRTKAAAERWAREVEGKMDAGAFQALRDEARRLTLADACDQYERDVTPRKRGQVQERRRLDYWRAHELADRPLAAIMPADVARHRDARLAAGLSANTVRLELALLSHLYAVARREWGMAGIPNPVAETRKPSTAGTARTRRLMRGEEGRLLWACRRSGPPWLPHVVVLAIETGMRRGEIAGLDPAMIDGNVAHLPRTKNGDARAVPLSPRAQAAIRRALRAHRRRKMPLAHEITQRFTAAAKAGGLRGLVFHDLRREAVSRLFERGFALPEVAAISGHRTWSQLAVYTRPRAADLAAKLAQKSPPREAQAGKRETGAANAPG